MKISAFLDCLSPKLEEQFKYAKELKLESISLRNFDGKKPHQLNDNDVSKIVDLVREYRIKVALIDTGIERYECYDNASHNVALGKFIKVSNLANKIGALNISINLPNFRVASIQDHSQVRNRINDYAAITDKAKRILVLERSKTETGGSFTVIANELKSKYIGVVYSPEITVKADDSISTSYRLLKSRTFFVNISDFDDKFNPQLIGYGNGELIDLFKKLKADNYQNYINLDCDFSDMIGDINRKTTPKERKGFLGFFKGESKLKITKRNKNFILFKKRLGVKPTAVVTHFMIIEHQIGILRKIFN